MKRQGKIFTAGILVAYLIAATMALVMLSSGIIERLPEHAIGEHQGAIVAAYDRAEQKLYYLREAASAALEEVARLLYQDQVAFFRTGQGDSEEGLGCPTYRYQLWNTEEERCLTGGEEDFVQIAAAMSEKVARSLGQAAMAYPFGSFPVRYELALTSEEASFSGEPLEEAILLGLTPGAESKPVTDTFDGASVGRGLLWPSSGSKTITSCFGPREYEHASSNIHHGMDVGAQGEVLAAADGVVMNDAATSTHGTVWIKHSPTLSTRYLHLEKAGLDWKPGDRVTAGTPLGKASNTGCPGCGDHLHFEVLVSQLPANSAHAYQNIMSGWYSVNPVCFFSEETLAGVGISPSSTQSCLRADYPSEPKRAYCAEYGFEEFLDPRAFTQGSDTGQEDEEGEPVTTEEPAAGPDVERPTTLGEEGAIPGTFDFELTQRQADDYQRAYLNQQEHGWGEYVVEASVKYGVDPALIRAIITRESLGDPLVVGTTKDAGIMQLNYRYAGANPELNGIVTDCGCTSTRATPGSGCRCSPENDWRLRAREGILAGTWHFKQDLRQFTSNADQLRFAVASYNMGAGRIRSAIRALGGDPAWEEVVAYLRREGPGMSPPLSRETIDHVNEEYVAYVMALAQAWNAGEPLDPRRATRVQPYREIDQVGTYRHPASFTLPVADRFTPFLDLVAWANEALDDCASADLPGQCLTAAAAGANVLTACEPDPGVEYFAQLYEALRDCRENGQRECACSLPRPPTLVVDGDYRFSIDAVEGRATLAKNGMPVTGLSFEEVSEKTIRVGPGEGIVPHHFTITLRKEGEGQELLLEYEELVAEDERGPEHSFAWHGAFVVEKGSVVDRLSFQEASSGLPECAPVKTKYAFCKEVLAGEPPVRFALTLLDKVAPEHPELEYAPYTVTYSSPSPDVSFYNVYDAAPRDDLRPVLQLRRAGSFDASDYQGRRLYVTAVDRAGNEGDPSSVLIRPPQSN